jgi:ferredoxin
MNGMGPVTAALVMILTATPCLSFGVTRGGRISFASTKPKSRLFSDWNDRSQDSNAWSSSDDPEYQDQEDWQEILSRKKEGSFWSEFESSPEADEIVATKSPVPTDEEAADAWLDTLASLSAQEVEFNLKEADRADKVRQMEEWGFTPETISNTLDVAVDDKLEQDVEGMKLYRQESYEDDIDLTTVESHSRVEKDPETGEPIRSQMVYVDEHTCIGCTNCAMIAQSTFFMHDEHGRARVFDQWGDDDETIQIAIETCPVDCIHYVPYDELVKLEVERRDQNINFKARLVSQGEYSGLGLSHKVGGATAFTAPQKISGNSMARCNNCPSRGCSNCPMYGVGKNPVFEEKEKLRQERLAKKRIQQERENQNKSADL